MIYNVHMSIAVKNFYNQYDVDSFCLFQLHKVNRKFTSLRIKFLNKKYILVKINCPICGGCHYYRYNINEFMRKKITVGGCEILGVPLFYMGSEEEVTKKVTKYNNVNKRLYAMI